MKNKKIIYFLYLTEKEEEHLKESLIENFGPYTSINIAEIIRNSNERGDLIKLDERL